MRFIICGAGQVGFSIAHYLSQEDNDITVIDPSPDLINRISENLDVRAVLGHPAHPDVLDQAGAADADILIAVAVEDEVNMVAAQVAHSLFDVPVRIARLRAPAYLDARWADLFQRDHMPVDFIISPEQEVAQTIYNRIRVPGAFDVIPLAADKIRVIGLTCDENCPVLNTPLRQLSTLFPDLQITIVGVVRDDHWIVPTGSDQFLAGDQVYLIANRAHSNRIMSAFGHEEKESHRIIVAGGGNVGLGLGQALLGADAEYELSLIEWSRDRAEIVADKLKGTTVLHGDALDREILEEAGIRDTDTFVAVTDDDEVNILSCLLAKKHGCSRVLALVNSSSYELLIGSLGVDIVVNPRGITVSKILQHVRRGRIQSVHSLGQGFGEVIEADILETSRMAGKAIRDLNLPKGTIVGAILRNQSEVIIPRLHTVIEAHDRVMVFTPHSQIAQIEKMICVQPEFF